MSETIHFFDDGDRMRHEWLIERGYRYYGRDRLNSHAYLYQKRFCDHESDHHDPDKCLVNVMRYDLSDCMARTPKHPPISYEVDMYFERADGSACKILLYGFPAIELQKRLPALEADCLAAWDATARKHYPTNEETGRDE